MLDYYLYLKQNTGVKRGKIPASPPWNTGDWVPVLTWKDAMGIYSDLIAKSKPLPDAFEGWFSEDPPENYKRAKRQFKEHSPTAMLKKMYGADGDKKYASHANLNYPFASDFWWYAKNFALYRNSLGAIQPWTGRLWDSTKESAEEALNKAKDATGGLADMIKDMSNIVKWGTIGMIALGGYWYVLRPQAKKQKRLRS